jgi:glycosyltransferase involved in cell wall biosynthesis
MMNLPSEETKPIFSVITVVRNGAETIPHTIESVFIQDFSNFEYILVDGLSTDGTREYVSKISSSRLKFVSERDHGIYDAMNKGIALSSGEWITLINADDALIPNVLTDVSKIIHENPDVEIIYGGLRDMDSNEVIQGISHLELPYRMIFHPGAFVKKSLYEKIGMFDTTYKVAGDYDFMLRAYNSKANFFDAGFPLALYRGAGYSSNFWKLGIWESQMIRSRNGHLSYFNAVFGFITVVLKTYIRKISLSIRALSISRERPDL